MMPASTPRSARESAPVDGPRVEALAARGVAVVVPLLNEAAEAPRLAARLAALHAATRRPLEIIVVDGGSHDGSPALLAARCPAARVVTARRGRAAQMNAGAAATSARMLVFLHADTELPPGALDAAAHAVDGDAGFGCFRVRIDSRDPRLRLAARLINLRSSLLPSATGDQALFVRRDLFEAVGGFPDAALCEDLALVERLRRRARFALLDPAVTTSARRWERRGVGRTILLMWTLRAAWHCGVPPRWLARLYDEVR